MRTCVVWAILLQIIFITPAFPAMVAGNATPGSNSYALAEMKQVCAGPSIIYDEYNPRCVLVDHEGGYAYYGMGLSPALVVKIRLSDFTRVGMLNLGVNQLSCGVIDPAGGHAYFGTGSGVVRVRLSDFKKDGMISYPSSAVEGLVCAAIDTSAGYAYFGAMGSPTGSVLKIRLSDFTLVATLNLIADEKYPSSIVIDPSAGFFYMSVYGEQGISPGKIVKVRLSDFSRFSALAVGSNGSMPYCGVIDPAGGYAYFGLSRTVIRVCLSDCSLAGTVPLLDNESYVCGAAIDPAGGFTYYTAYDQVGDSGHVIKISLSWFMRAETLVLPRPSAAAAVDAEGGYAYFAQNYLPAKIVRVPLSGSMVATTIKLVRGDNQFCTANIDPSGQYGYFGLNDVPGKWDKIRLSDLTRSASLDLPDDNVHCAVMDHAGVYGYIGSHATGRIFKVRLSDMKLMGTITLTAKELSLSCATIDPTDTYAYFGTSTAPSNVIKIRLSDFKRIATLVLSIDKYICGAAMDPLGKYAYFITDGTAISNLVKIRLSDFQRESAVTFSEKSLDDVAVDHAGAYAYVAATRSRQGAAQPAHVLKVRLSGENTITTLTLATNEELTDRIVIDPVDRYAYVGVHSYTNVSKIVKLSLTPFARLGQMDLGDTEFTALSAAIDSKGRFAYFGGQSEIMKVGLSYSGSIHANKIAMPVRGKISNLNFYTHAAGGHVRLAIYDDSLPKKLLWQSAELSIPTAKTWVSSPISSGTPGSLTLEQRKYWLAWQTDTTADVPSLSSGTAGCEFTCFQPYGSYPLTISGSVQQTSDLWSIYLTYSPYTGAGEWMLYR